jgi:glycosyltransferase involved in cell wall biosynthesis
MIICYIANGASIHTQRWVRHFVSLGYEVHLFSPVYADINGVTLHELPSQRGAIITTIPYIRRQIKAINPDIIHAHQLYACGWYAVLCGRRPVVVSAWGSDVLWIPQQSVLRGWIVKFVIKHADLITSDAQIVTQRLIELGTQSSKILTFPMGVNKNFYDNFEGINRAEDKIFIFSPREHKKFYNIEVIIRSMKEIIKIIPEVHLLITGDGEERKKLEELSKKLGISEKISFLGVVPHSSIIDILKKCHILISIPDYDATSVSLLEGMAAGLFPIVSNIPANREWIIDGENGYLVPAKDIEMLAKQIVEAIKNKPFRLKAGKKCREIIYNKAIWEKNIKPMEDFYMKVRK